MSREIHLALRFDDLVLVSNPTKRSLENAFRGATALFYVKNNNLNAGSK